MEIYKTQYRYIFGLFTDKKTSTYRYSHFARYKTEHGVFFLLHIGYKLNCGPLLFLTVPPQQQLVVLVARSKGSQTRNMTQGTRPRSHGTRHGHETVSAAAAASLVRLPCNSDCVLYEFGIRHARRRNTRACFALVLRHIRKTRRSALAAAEQETPRSAYSRPQEHWYALPSQQARRHCY